MSPQLWNNISYILLVTGILFFTVTVILAVKFQLLTMLKAEVKPGHKLFRTAGTAKIKCRQAKNISTMLKAVHITPMPLRRSAQQKISKK